MNLALIFGCKCNKDNKAKIIHISDLYNIIEFKNYLTRVKIGQTLEYYNKLKLFIPKTISIIRKIILFYFKDYSDLFIFNKKNFENCNIDEHALQFFDEKNS